MLLHRFLCRSAPPLAAALAAGRRQYMMIASTSCYYYYAWLHVAAWYHCLLLRAQPLRILTSSTSRRIIIITTHSEQRARQERQVYPGSHYARWLPAGAERRAQPPAIITMCVHHDYACLFCLLARRGAGCARAIWLAAGAPSSALPLV